MASTITPFTEFDDTISMTKLNERGGTFLIRDVWLENKVNSDGETRKWAHARILDAETGEVIGTIHTPGAVLNQLEPIAEQCNDNPALVVGPVRILHVGRVLKFEAV